MASGTLAIDIYNETTLFVSLPEGYIPGSQAYGIISYVGGLMPMRIVGYSGKGFCMGNIPSGKEINIFATYVIS